MLGQRLASDAIVMDEGCWGGDAGVIASFFIMDDSPTPSPCTFPLLGKVVAALNHTQVASWELRANCN